MAYFLVVNFKNMCEWSLYSPIRQEERKTFSLCPLSTFQMEQWNPQSTHGLKVKWQETYFVELHFFHFYFKSRTLLAARERSCGKVMFSHVRLFVHKKGRGPMWPLLMMHWTTLYRDPPPTPPLPRHGTSLDRHPLLVTSGGHHCWITPLPHRSWHLVAVAFEARTVSTSGRYYVLSVVIMI